MIQGLAKNRTTAARIEYTGATSWHYYAILAVLGLLLAVFFREEYLGAALYPIQVFIAGITTSLLSLIDVQVIQKGSILVHSGGFACEITPGCTGLIALIIFAASVLMYPARPSHKIAGLLAGTVFLIGFNFVRLVHLVYIGSHHPSWFDIAHWVVWQTLIALSVVAAWWVWTAWSQRRQSNPI